MLRKQPVILPEKPEIRVIVFLDKRETLYINLLGDRQGIIRLVRPDTGEQDEKNRRRALVECEP